MTLSVNKIGLNNQKISFGKGMSGSGYHSDKDCSSSSSSRSYEEEAPIYRAPKSSSNNRVTREELLDKLSQYADDPVMVRIITQQLKNLC